MKAIATEKYSMEKLDRIKRSLENQAKTGLPKQYEIFINGLKVVGRTNNPQLFDNYLQELEDDDTSLEVIIYGSHENCTRGNSYKFTFNEEKPTNDNTPSNALQEGEQFQKALDEAVNKKMNLEMERLNKQREFQDMKSELVKTKSDLKQAEEYVKKLSDELVVYQNKKLYWGNVNIAEATGMILEGIARRNVHLIAKIPGAQALAGLIAQDNQQANQPRDNSSNSQISIEPADQGKEELLQLLNMFEENFNESELEQLQGILEKFLAKKELIQQVAELIK